MEHGFTEGIRLFNEAKFFEAHEALEALWLKATGERKVFLHGLIQVAAAFHHHARNNPAGFHSLLEKGCRKLEAFGADFQGVDLSGLMSQLQLWKEQISQSSAGSRLVPTLPRIEFTSRL